MLTLDGDYRATMELHGRILFQILLRLPSPLRRLNAVLRWEIVDVFRGGVSWQIGIAHQDRATHSA
jgi:hypothetical protein